MSFVISLIGVIQELDDEHIHSSQLVAPAAAAPVLCAAGAPGYGLGIFSNAFLANGFVPFPFDVHWVDISNISANDDYEITFYYGLTDIFLCAAAFTRSGPQLTSFHMHLQSIIVPAGSRIRARLASAAGGNNCNAKIFYHEYR